MKREKRDEIRDKIKKIKEKFNYQNEIKWNKVSSRFLSFYKKIVDLFFKYSADDLQFHCIKIERQKVEYKMYHNNDTEEGFYKFYYQLLKNKFASDCEYYIFLDFKPTKSKKRVAVLEHYLKYRVLNYSNSKIKKVQEYPSQNNIFIQLADLFVGAVNYDNNIKSGKSNAKKELIKHLAKKIGQSDLKFCSLPSESKFNIFCIDLNLKYSI